MNRLKTKKKTTKDSIEEERRDSNDETSKTKMPLKHTKTFRFGRKAAQEPEPAPELDLENALPKTDDFRTSLLMSGLSARFSMLREQDDPLSLIGKASDDSVLFPQRQSRLFDFGYTSNGLSDIAEVSSIRSSNRPPLPIGMDRTTSAYSLNTYGNEDDGGSVMNRGKPAELGGNNLFGGRQKIYKLPNDGLGSSKNLAGDGEAGSMSSRVLYGDDVSMSAFQKLREKEKRQQREQKDLDQPTDLRTSMTRRSSSPDLVGYNQDRETTSTTDSDPSLTRSSTAATSVASFRTPSVRSRGNPLSSGFSGAANQSALERNGTKSKRLYETGLDQHIHNQQSSTMSRLDSISRQRNIETVSPSPSLTSPLNNTFDIPEGHEQELPSQQASYRSRAQASNSSFDFGTNRAELLNDNRSGYSTPPLSPPMSEGDEQSILPIGPNDRGKATAGGVFSKPAQPYDDMKYAQRQLQMRNGHATPLAQRDTAAQVAMPQPYAYPAADVNVPSSTDRTKSPSAGPWVPPTHSNLPLPLRSEPRSVEICDANPNPYLFSDHDDNSKPHLETEVDKRLSARTKPQPLQPSSGNVVAPSRNVAKPPDAEHPAIRQRSIDSFGDPAEHVGTERTSEDSTTSGEKSEDSPTLPSHSVGLSGMVRQHLRSDSNASSIYDTPSPGLTSRFPHGAYSHSSIRDDAWPADPSDIYPDPLESEAPFHTEQEAGHDEIPSSQHNKSFHQRDASTATQKEREEFQEALAARRRRVQDNLRSFVDPDNRPGSAPFSIDHVREHNAARNHQAPRAILRPAPPSLKSRDGHFQPMKMLGLGNSTTSDNTPPNTRHLPPGIAKHQGPQSMRGILRPVRSATDGMALDQARRDFQYRTHQHDNMMDRQHRPMEGQRAPNGYAPRQHGSPRDGHREMRSQSRQGNRAQSRQGDRSQSRHGERSQSRQDRMPPVSYSREIDERTGSSPDIQDRSGSRPSSRTARSRSNSELSGPRSKSRTGKYRDDLARAMAEGTASSAQTTIDEVPATMVPARSPHPESAPYPDYSDTRARSNSRAVGLGVYDSQQHSLPTNSANFMSPRPSPVAPPTASPPALPSTSGMSIVSNGHGSQSDSTVPAIAARKRPVNKAEISEPTFVSSTARMTTVKLSDASPLQSLNITAPPVPAINPRRRQTRIQTMFGSGGKSEEDLGALTSPIQGHEVPGSTQTRLGKLRKSSSEGGNLRARANAAYMASPNPAMPHSATMTPPISPPTSYDGEMF